MRDMSLTTLLSLMVSRECQPAVNLDQTYRAYLYSVYSVALSAPAVFQFTAPSSPERHREALAIFRGVTPTDPAISKIPETAIGGHLFEAIAQFLDGLDVPRGLKAVGYSERDVRALVEGTIPQRRLLDLAPGVGDVVDEDGRECLTWIVENAMAY